MVSRNHDLAGGKGAVGATDGNNVESGGEGDKAGIFEVALEASVGAEDFPFLVVSVYDDSIGGDSKDVIACRGNF